MGGHTNNHELPYPVLDDPADVPADMQELAEKLDTLGFVPPGAVFMWLAALAPAGFYVLQGQEVPSADNPTLAQMFPVAVGMVRLPDLRQRMPLGAGGTYALGTPGGAATHKLLAAEMPKHKHVNAGVTDHAHSMTIEDSNHAHGPAFAGGQFVIGSAGYAITHTGISPIGSNQKVPIIMHIDAGFGGTVATTTQNTNHKHGINGAGAHNHDMTELGADAEHNNMPPYIVVNFVIRGG